MERFASPTFGRWGTGTVRPTLPFVRTALLSFWNEPPVADPPRRVWRDWALVALLVPAAVLEVILREDVTYRWVSFVVCLAGMPFLLVRRTHPLLAVAVTFGATIVIDIPWLLTGFDGFAPGLYTSAYVVVLAYALFRWGSGREALIGFGIILTAALISLVFDFSTLSESITGFTLFLLIIAAGAVMRYRTRARVSKRDEMRAREREGLARDLHDTVAHHVSAIAIRAQAGLAVAGTDPAAATEALRVIDAEASRTLAEMRTIVCGLRDEEPLEFAPLPGIADVHGLAQTAPGEVPVRISVEGDSRRVPAPVAAAAYRLVQESLTNARRHARRASQIDVRVRTGDDAVTVEVTDDGDASVRHGAGYGIVGMMERAEALGGTCVVGPRADRGWAVIAVLPLKGASA